MREEALRVLKFFRFVDEKDGLISLTNIAMWIAIIKLATTSSANMEDIGSLFTVLLAYVGKKYINQTGNSNQ